jgi:CRP/FNR family transcriptional regulator, cyclic AMP receptor protein
MSADKTMSMFDRFRVTFEKGDVIFCEYEPGDTFYLIQKGRVQIVKIMGELEKTVAILQPNEFFGEMAILEEAPRSATAIAMDPVTALAFNRENFEVLMQGYPQMALRLLKLFAVRIYDQKRKFMILTLDDVEAKVADVFLMLAESEPINRAEVEAMQFNTTVDDIAHWAGINPAKCREVINHFGVQRRVEVYPDRIVVKNINDFARFVATRRRNQERSPVRGG